MIKLAFTLATFAALGALATTVAADGTPTPPKEIADLSHNMAGTWSCKGTATGPDHKDVAFTGSFASKLDLDSWWMHDSFTGSMQMGGKAAAYKFESFVTYDAKAKKYREVFVDNFGGQMVGTSDGMTNATMQFDLDAVSFMGQSKFRDHVDAGNSKALHVWGETSLDGGKTFAKDYDMTCSK